MTCIVGVVTKRGVMLGGDSHGSNGLDAAPYACPKVFRLSPEVAAGYCGSFRMGQVIEFHLRGKEIPQVGRMDEYEWVVTEFIPVLRSNLKAHGYATVKNGEETGGTFLLAVRRRLFKVQDDFSVLEPIRGHHAVGCGADYAMGAMFTLGDKVAPRARLRRGLEAAHAYQPGAVGPPYRFVETKGAA